MKQLIFIFSVCGFLFSCKKENIDPNFRFPQGIYVEETLRFDTIDFTLNNLIDYTTPQFELTAKPFTESGTNPTQLIYISSNFEFNLEINKINLRSYLSSNSNFQPYFFSWNKADTFFTIDKFYHRNALPQRLRFVRI